MQVKVILFETATSKCNLILGHASFSVTWLCLRVPSCSSVSFSFNLMCGKVLNLQTKGGWPCVYSLAFAFMWSRHCALRTVSFPTPLLPHPKRLVSWLLKKTKWSRFSVWQLITKTLMFWDVDSILLQQLVNQLWSRWNYFPYWKVRQH